MTDHKDLTDRLRDPFDRPANAENKALRDEAADALEGAVARIAELEAERAALIEAAIDHRETASRALAREHVARAQIAEIVRLCDETDTETNEPTQAWLVGNIRAALHRGVQDAAEPGDRYREGYRIGFGAGKEAALREASARVPRMQRPAPTPRRVTRKCQCGHSINTHNELGYCQARHDKSTPKGINGGCFCDGFVNAEEGAK